MTSKFKTRGMVVGVCWVLAIVFGLSGQAMAFGHYTPGVEGIYAATLPPSGFHYLMYNVFYDSDTLMDDAGDELDVGLDLNVFANAHRFVYITGHKILGGDFGFDAIVPVIYTDIQIDALGVDEDTFGIGDVCLEPFVLGWHLPRWDFVVAAGVYLPSGEHEDTSSPGLGYWSFMESLGATFYFDEARTWTFSVLTRWLQNTEDDDTDTTPGADMVAEYGLGKLIPLNETLLLTVGMAGYSYAQLAEDSGDASDDDKFIAHAAGPEIRLMSLKPFPMQVILRYLFEYGAENTTEGHNACLTLIGSF